MTGLIIEYISCIILSAIFSGVEVAFSSSNILILENLKEKNNKLISHSLACKIVKNFKTYLPVILLGNNIVNISIASIATRIGIITLSERYCWIFTILSTLFVIIFSETIPKILARDKNISISIAFSIPIQTLYIFLFPIIYPLNIVFNFINKHDNSSQNIESEEIALAVEEIRESGAIDAQEEELLVNSIDFDDICVSEISIHRVDIEGIDIDSDISDIINIGINTRYSRLIVFQRTHDDILGILITKTLLKLYLRYGNDNEIMKEKIRENMFSPLYIHMTMGLNTCLNLMKREKKHLAVINDEFGGTYGIITMENILEELSGEIWDESDEIKADIEKKSDNTYYVNGSVEIPYLLEELDVNIDEDDLNKIESNSIGGLAFEILDRLPRKGDKFTFAGIDFTVGKVSDRRVVFLNAKLSDSIAVAD